MESAVDQEIKETGLEGAFVKSWRDCICYAYN